MIKHISNFLKQTADFGPNPDFKSILIKRAVIGVILTVAVWAWCSVRILYYAEEYGARYPFEGVVFGKFVLTVTTVYAFCLTTLFSFPVIKAQFFDTPTSKTVELSLRNELIFNTVSAIIFVLGCGGILKFIPLPISEDTSKTIFVSFLVVAILHWFISFPIQTNRVREYLLYILAIGVTVTVAYSITGSKLPHTLRVYGYGGGRIISVETNTSNSYPNVGLFLRTQNSITLFDDKSHEFIELPANSIRELRYRAFDNESDPFLLPPKAN